MTLNSQIAQQIKLARTKKGLTQKELGKKLGKSGAAIAYLEQGKRRISPNVLQQIADITEKPLSFFYGQTEQDEASLKSQLQELRQEMKELKAILSSNVNATGQAYDSFQQIFEEANDQMILMDLEGKIIDVNQSYAELFGWSRQEMKGRPFWDFDLVERTEMPRLVKMFEDAMARQNAVQFVRLSMRNRSGETVEVQASSRILKDQDRPWGMFSILRPVTVQEEVF